MIIENMHKALRWRTFIHQGSMKVYSLVLPGFLGLTQFQVSWYGWKWKLLTMLHHMKCIWKMKFCATEISHYILHLNRFECMAFVFIFVSLKI